MQKNITIVVFVYLFFMFLAYSGVFRDYTDPRVTAKYYFDCLKNREGFLTYKISKPEFFNDDRGEIFYSKYRLFSVKRIKLDVLDLNDKHAIVEAKIIYNDKKSMYSKVELERNDNIWLISNVSFYDF